MLKSDTHEDKKNLAQLETHLCRHCVSGDLCGGEKLKGYQKTTEGKAK